MSESTSNTNSTCIIAKGTIIEGDFETLSNVRLDGVIKGNIKCGGKIIMGKSGSINGTINTDHTTIEGNFEGELHVKDTLHLLTTARVNGTFKAGKLIVDEGAVLNGECSIGGKLSGHNRKA